MKKIKREKFFKREYIPVVLAGAILFLLIMLLTLLFMHEPSYIKEEIDKDKSVNIDELIVDDKNNKCSAKEMESVINSANKISAEYDATLVYTDMSEEDINNFEPEELEEMYPEHKWYDRKIVIKLKDLSDDVYVEIRNDYNDNIITVTSSDAAKGEYTFYGEALDKIVTYYVSVYAAKDKCMGSEVRKVSFQTMIFNIWSEHMACTMYPKYNNCAKLVEKELSYDLFDEGLQKYKKNNPAEAKQGEENALNAFYNVYDIAQEEKKQEEAKQKETDRQIQIKKDRRLILISLSIIGIGVLVIILLAILRRNKL